MVNGQERFCRFNINMIVFDHIKTSIFSIRERHFRKPFSPLYYITGFITAGSGQEPVIPPDKGQRDELQFSFLDNHSHQIRFRQA